MLKLSPELQLFVTGVSGAADERVDVSIMNIVVVERQLRLGRHQRHKAVSRLKESRLYPIRLQHTQTEIQTSQVLKNVLLRIS